MVAGNIALPPRIVGKEGMSGGKGEEIVVGLSGAVARFEDAVERGAGFLLARWCWIWWCESLRFWFC